MSVAVRLPIVYASAAALNEWERLAPNGGVLENRVRRLVLDGQAKDPRKTGGSTCLPLGDGLRAQLIRSRRASGRLSWLVTAVEVAR